MSVSVPPSRDPSTKDNASGSLRFLLKKFLASDIDNMLPAAIVAFDDTSNLATVRPLIQKVTTTGNTVNRGDIAAVPVLRIGGQLVLHDPPVAGDLGWIHSADRDTSLFKKAWRLITPGSKRMHSFSDGLFIPDAMLNMVLNSEDIGIPTLQAKDGSIRLSFRPNWLKITTPRMSIGDGSGYSSSAGALLDLVSTSKALGLPAMSTGQKNAIASPRLGFMVYDTTENGISVYGPAGWS